jgi:hypothetical protein
MKKRSTLSILKQSQISKKKNENPYLQVPPITQADSAYALEAAESLGIPAWRFQPYQPGTKAIEVVPVGQATITPQPIPERYTMEHTSMLNIEKVMSMNANIPKLMIL